MSIPFVKDFDNLAANIANPPADRPIAQAVGNFGRSVCDRISARPDLYAPTILQSPLRAACQPYWDGAGVDGPVEQVPFTGGQCDAIKYSVSMSFNGPTGTNGFGECLGDNVTPFTAQAWGPIGAVKLNGDGGCTNRGSFANATLNCRGFGFSAPGPLGDYSVVAGVVFSCRVISTSRMDGGTDDCGDPPPEFVPGPNPSPDPGPLPPGTGPIINIRGNPVLVLPPTLEFAPGLGVTFAPGEVNLGGGVGGGPAEEPLGAEEQPGAGGPGGGGGDNDFGEPPDGERWCGVCVKINVQPPGAGSIPQAEPESIYPTTIGNVRLRFRAADAIAEYDTPIVNRQKTSCVWEPVRGLNPTGVRVNLLPGYSYTFRPYSVPLEN